MPDLAALLLHSSLGRLGPAGDRCADCRRMPLAGERMHELDSGRTLCDLCFAALPDGLRQAVRSQRVHTSERRLAVARRPA